MASLITYTKQLLIERIKRHIANDFPSVDFSASDNEVLLYIDQALAANLIGQVFNNAKVEGSIAVPEAYLTTYLLPSLQQDLVTKEWTTTLPQPPVSLPLGYSVDNIYFANSINGKGASVFLIKSKRVSYRNNMPKPYGVSARIEGSKLILEANNGQTLSGQNVYARMITTRTESLTDIMALPDDAIEIIFMNVVAKLKDRLGLPKDVILDDISAGSKAS